MKNKVFETGSPNKLIRHLMEKEGGKSSMKVHECREMLKDLVEVLAAPKKRCPLMNEFFDYVAYTAERIYGKHSVSNIEFWITWELMNRTDAAGKRQLKQMKKAQAEAKAAAKSKALKKKGG